MGNVTIVSQPVSIWDGYKKGYSLGMNKKKERPLEKKGRPLDKNRDAPWGRLYISFIVSTT